MTPALAIAPHFHLAGTWADRLLVEESGGWRSPNEGELAALVRTPRKREELADCVCLFAVPEHSRSAFWAMLAQAAEGEADFVGFAAEVERFLTFKQVPPPDDAVFELLLHTEGATFDPSDLWGVVNLNEAPAFLGWPGLRVRLGPGEGCRVPQGQLPELLAGEGDNAFLVVRCAREVE